MEFNNKAYLKKDCTVNGWNLEGFMNKLRFQIAPPRYLSVYQIITSH